MEQVHLVLAWASVAAVALGIAWAAVLMVQRRRGGRQFVRYQAIVVLVVLLAAVAGAARLVTGGSPADNLHLLYGVVAVGAIPFARSFVAGRERRETLLVLVAFVVLAVVLFRLFATA